MKYSYIYAFEKIFIKALNRNEICICLYKDMRDRSGLISNGLLVRPLDLTEMELKQLLEKAIKEKLFSTEFMEYLKKMINQNK